MRQSTRKITMVIGKAGIGGLGGRNTKPNWKPKERTTPSTDTLELVKDTHQHVSELYHKVCAGAWVGEPNAQAYAKVVENLDQLHKLLGETPPKYPANVTKTWRSVKAKSQRSQIEDLYRTIESTQNEVRILSKQLESPQKEKESKKKEKESKKPEEPIWTPIFWVVGMAGIFGLASFPGVSF